MAGVDFDADAEFDHLLNDKEKGSPLTGAHGGYLLVRFDVDDAGYSVVNVDPPGGWWGTDRGPVGMISRAADYLAILRDKLQAIDDLGRSSPR